MYARIPWEKEADAFGTEDHALVTTALTVKLNGIR
jgi:hypothetical protein